MKHKKKRRFHVSDFEYDLIYFYDYWTYVNDWSGLHLGNRIPPKIVTDNTRLKRTPSGFSPHNIADCILKYWYTEGQ